MHLVDNISFKQISNMFIYLLVLVLIVGREMNLVYAAVSLIMFCSSEIKLPVFSFVFWFDDLDDDETSGTIDGYV